MKKKRMKELSIFIDESGDFGALTECPAYYLVTMVFHNQEVNLSEQIEKLEISVKSFDYNIEYIHTGPLIRREDIFRDLTIDERRKLLYKMLNFFMNSDIFHRTIKINKKHTTDKGELSKKIAKEISSIVQENQEYFFSFDKIIVYYDNGQTELNSILNEVFSVYFANVDFRKAEPQKYSLLQMADFICSLELVRIKREEHRLSKSEEKFFYKPQELKKTFLKSIDKKRLR